MTSALIDRVAVMPHRILTASDGAAVGYLQFNTHVPSAEQALVQAVEAFRAGRIRDLVLDLRYNAGGLSVIANQLAYMIAGPTRTAGRAFQFVGTHRAERAERFAFMDTSCELVNQQCTTSTPLPTLNLARVFILSGPGTCSASELLINGLNGIGMPVVLIGGTTCGKPYGFNGHSNCGYDYFPIALKASNDRGFSDYADGLVPGGTGPNGVNGCPMREDLAQALGDPNERLLAAAMTYRVEGRCPAAKPGDLEAQRPASADAWSRGWKHPLRENAIFKVPR